MVNPRVTLLLPIGGSAPYLAATLKSISSQTLKDWHLIAVLDGASPAVEGVVREYINPDQLTCIKLSRNVGVAAALNVGLSHVTSPLTARIDADDIASPMRLERQVQAMELWHDVVALGSAAQLIDEEGREMHILHMAAGRNVTGKLLKRNEVVHPSAIFRTEAVKGIGGYNENCRHAEDYELWLRLGVVGDIANLPDPLISYRISPGQVSLSRAPLQTHRAVFNARRRLGAYLGARPMRVVLAQAKWSVGQWRFLQRRLGRLKNVRRHSNVD